MGNAAATPSFPSAASTTPTIKLLIDKESERVLLAEAGKDVVDFLFGLLAMPVGAVLKLLAKDSVDAFGSFSNIYSSAGKMDASYMQSQSARNALLNPNPVHPSVTAAAGGFPSLVQQLQPTAPAMPPSPSPRAPTLSSLKTLQLPPFGATSRPHTYSCPACLCGYRTYDGSYHCACMARSSSSYAGQGSRGVGGFVKDVVTYTIMDDLTITPMSNISGIALLSKLGIEEIVVFEEKTVKIGYQEGLEILKASLQSKTVLTDVFMAKKKRARRAHDKNDTSVQEENTALIQGQEQC